MGQDTLRPDAAWRLRVIAARPDPRTVMRSRFLAASMASTGRTRSLPVASTETLLL